MENWQRKVSEAINEFSEAKAKENEALCAFQECEGGADQEKSVTLKNCWLDLQRAAQQKNDAVLRLIQSIPKATD